MDYQNQTPSVEQEQPETDPSGRPRCMILWIAAAAGMILLLGAGAFMAVRLAGLGRSGLRPSGGQPVGGLVPPKPGSSDPVNVGVEIDMTPAPELPITSPDIEGTFARRDGSSLFVNQTNTGQVTIISADGYSSGPEVEIVVTKDTQIFKDLTALPEIDASGNVAPMEQKVELMQGQDGIGLGTMLSAWGEKRGDRFIAQVILYTDMRHSSN